MASTKKKETNFVPTRIRYTDSGESGLRRRQGHLMALLPLTRLDSETGELTLQEFRVYVELSAFLAFQHVERRSGQVLSGLPSLLEQCDFTWTYRHHDTQFSPLQAARALLSYELPEGSRPPRAWVRPVHVNNVTSIISNSNNYTDTEATNSIAATTVVSNNDYDNPYWAIPKDNEEPTSPSGTSPPSATPINRPIVATSTKRPTRAPSSGIPSSVPPRLTEPPVRTAVPLREENPWADSSKPTNTRPSHSGQRHLQAATEEQQQQQQQQKPFAVLGAARSVVSQTVGILGSAFELPQISSSSTAASLDDLPFFARTISTNEGDAHAIIVYLRQQLGVSHMGVLHAEDSWGRRYEQDLQHYGNRYGMVIKSVAYDMNSLETTMIQLKETNLRYFIAIIIPSEWKPVVQAAYNYGLMGNPDNQWFIGDLVELVGAGFALDRATEHDIAVALHGTGVVSLQLPPHEAFDSALAAVASNVTLQQEFIASHAHPELLENFTFSESPGMSLFQYLTYDAVVALGITACNTPGLFTGQQFFKQLLKVDFQGVSGRVILNNVTGTRLGDSLQYQIVNMILDDFVEPTANLSSPTMTFRANISSLVDLLPSNGTGPVVHVMEPFVYHNNSTNPPLVLIPEKENLNLIPPGVIAFGLVLSISVMLLSVAIGVWVLRMRNEYVIRASQPIFLVQICVGTFIIASAIIPLGWQEPKPQLGLDVACMSVPWLFAIGFTIAVSAIFSKTRRVNQLMNTSSGFRRIRVKPRDVMKATSMLLAINVILLTAWSASPWRMSWHRITVENQIDQFGRSKESYGVCRPNSQWHFLLTVPLVLTNALVLGMATYQSYRAKDLPSDFSETSYMAISMISLSEVFILGITVVFPVLDQPTAFYLLGSILYFVGCMAILGPMFAPKFAQRHTKAPRGRNVTSVIRSRPRRGEKTGGIASLRSNISNSGLDTSASVHESRNYSNFISNNDSCGSSGLKIKSGFDSLGSTKQVDPSSGSALLAQPKSRHLKMSTTREEKESFSEASFR